MATPQDISAKHAEFQSAVADLDNATATYEAAKTPYLVAAQAMKDAIDRVQAVDDEMETLTKDYEPPAHPAPQ